MKKTLFATAVAALALTGCAKVESVSTLSSNEIMLAPVNEDKSIETRGYAEGPELIETYLDALHGGPTKNPREMQISAYLYPQNGEEKNYFVDKTYAVGDDKLWHNKVKAGFEPIFWPVGGKMDFLAYSLTGELSGPGKSHNVTAVWGADNAADQVILTVPGENSQNDILFASASGVESSKTQKPVDMRFNHAQAWLEFVLSGSADPLNPDGIVTLRRIELEDVYNAGKLVISNNKGNAIAKWDFSGEEKQDIVVDNFANVAKLNGTKQFLDMLIPQQEKTAFVIYYTLGSSPKELSYRFTTDQKTWLMGEKYVYIINIKANEVTVAPTVTAWQNGEDEAFNFKVKTPATTVGNGTTTFGHVDVNKLPSDSFRIMGDAADDGSATYTCDAFGAQVILTAEPEEDCFFKEWSDGVTENPRTFTITEDAELPGAIMTGYVTLTIAPTEFGKITINGEELLSLKVISGTDVTLKATTGANFKFVKWVDENTKVENTDATRTVTVTENVTYTPYFGVGVDYVEIAAMYDGVNVTTLKWATQNLAISSSGKQPWANFKYENDRHIFQNGDYFQWGAYAGYCGNPSDADKGLLTYTSFTSPTAFNSKAGKGFSISNVPYYSGSAYTTYTGTAGDGLLELKPSDDVATIILGSSWRMPKGSDYAKMKNATYWAWDAKDCGFYVFAADATHAANSIVSAVPADLKKYNALLFFPAVGAGQDSEFGFVNDVCFYWARDFVDNSIDTQAYHLGLRGTNFGSINRFSNRYYGLPVRPVSY